MSQNFNVNTEEIVKTKEVIDNQGFLTKTKIIQYYSKMSPRGKYALWGYFSGIIIYNLSSSYNVGVNALKEHRKTNFPDNEKELKFVKNAIYDTSFSRFFNSLIFPYTIASEIVPSIVIATNKK